MKYLPNVFQNPNIAKNQKMQKVHFSPFATLLENKLGNR